MIIVCMQREPPPPLTYRAIAAIDLWHPIQDWQKVNWTCSRGEYTMSLLKEVCLCCNTCMATGNRSLVLAIGNRSAANLENLRLARCVSFLVVSPPSSFSSSSSSFSHGLMGLKNITASASREN